MGNGVNHHKKRERNDGFSEGLKPLKPLDLRRYSTVDELLKGMSQTAFGGRKLGEAAEALHTMAKDKDCFKVLTLSGAMTVAKQGLIIRDMIEFGMTDCIISTGAMMAHGFIESAGMYHFKHDRHMGDRELFEKGYNRVYDTLEPEVNFDRTTEIVHKVLDGMDPEKPLTSRALIYELGRYLSKHIRGESYLKSAFQKNIPIFVPAFTDSELGLDVAQYNWKRRLNGKKPFVFDAMIDLEEYTEMVKGSKRMGIFTIGGGVPRNWAQQAGPYLDLLSEILDPKDELRNSVPASEYPFNKKFHYAVRISQEPEHLGGLSGCSYSEGVSWGKFVSEKDGGVQVEVPADATIAWPFIVKAVMERLEGEKEKQRKSVLRAQVVSRPVRR